MFLWICCRVDKLKIFIFHDFNAVAFPNMKQPTSSESSATFMDQNNMYPLNDSAMPDFIALLDELVSTPDFTEPQKAAPAGRSESQFFLFCYLRDIH